MGLSSANVTVTGNVPEIVDAGDKVKDDPDNLIQLADPTDAEILILSPSGSVAVPNLYCLIWPAFKV